MTIVLLLRAPAIL